MRAPDYDVDTYNALLDEFKNSRKNVMLLTVYKELCLIKPNQNIPESLRYKLRKFCRTNSSSSWGACKRPAQEIWDFFLNEIQGQL
jgi:hypothetical protein